MKRSIILAITMIFLISVGSTVFATVSDDLIGHVDEEFGETRFDKNSQYSYYIKSDGTAAITDLSDGMRLESTIEFPAEIDGYRVTEITGSGAEYLTNVVIPDGVTRIRSGAFSGCKNLESIEIPESVTEFGTEVFWGCEKLTKVDLPGALEVIPFRTFFGCESLKSISVPAVTGVGEGAFYGCTNLETVIIKDSGQECIVKDTFDGCKQLSGAVFPASAANQESVALLWTKGFISSGDEADVVTKYCGTDMAWSFDKASGKLTLICTGKMPDFSQGGAPWYGYREDINRVHILGPAERLGTYALEGCMIEEITLPGSITSIGNNAFKDNSELSSVTVNNKYCTVEGSLDLPEDVTVYGMSGSGIETAALENGYTFECIDATHSHSWYVKTKKVTATEDGSETKICRECGEEVLENIIYHPVVTLSKTSYIYDGKSHKPTVTVKNSIGEIISSDFYTVFNYGEINTGTHKVLVRFQEPYDMQMILTYKITPKSISGMTAKVRPHATIYMGYPIEAEVSVGKLNGDCDYRVTYKNNKNAGTATVTIKGIGNYTGTITKTFTIARNSYVDELKWVENSKEVIYNGKNQKAQFIIRDHGGNKLVAGVDYKLTYSNSKRIDPGFYRVKVTYIKNYKGGEDVTLRVVPKPPSWMTAKLTTGTNGYKKVTVRWKKIDAATSYKISYKKKSETSYKYYGSTKNNYLTISGLQAGTQYDFKVTPKMNDYSCKKSAKIVSATTLKRVSQPTVKTDGTKVRVTWKNIAGETGYQISRSTSKTGTNIVKTIKTTTGKTTTVSATKGKTYYYKVRAYKTVNDKKVFAPWSEPYKFVRK